MSSSASRLSLATGVAIVVGSIIGSGLFIRPAAMAQQLSSPWLLLLVWVAAGLMSFIGALIFAELGAMLPKTGGLFVHFNHLFGAPTAFLYGWSAFSIINTASVAAIAFVCASYIGQFVPLAQCSEELILRYPLPLPGLGTLYPLKDIGIKAVAIILVMGFSFINAKSLRAGGRFQQVSAIINFSIIALLSIGLLTAKTGSITNLTNAHAPADNWQLLAGLVAAFTGAFFAYDGWINIVSMAGEIREPQKNIPRSLLLGVAICMFIYILINFSYFYVLPVDAMASSALVAADAMRVAQGEQFALLAGGMIVCCTIGAINANVMATARVTYAMGRDGVLSGWFGQLDKGAGTPKNALMLHGWWTTLLIATGSFDLLADMYVFITWMVYLLGAVGIFYWRYKEPAYYRPYKISGHPYLTLLFVLFSAIYLLATIYKDITLYLEGKQAVIHSLLALVIVLAGVPLYFISPGRRKVAGKID
ncbi:MAG: APC family permease [Sphingomonadales bacterium]